MAIVDVSIIPVGTGNPSVSEYVAEVQKVLEKNADRVKYQLTPMNTVIEGDLPVILEVIQQMHEVPYTKGAQRVATTIRIDDRRDKVSTMEKKLNSVRSNYKEKQRSSLLFHIGGNKMSEKFNEQFDGLLEKYTELLLGESNEERKEQVQKWALYSYIAKTMRL